MHVEQTTLEVYYGSHVIRLANMEMCGKAVMHQLGVTLSIYTNVSTLRGAYSFRIATGSLLLHSQLSIPAMASCFSTKPRCC